jgi:hypothetical protein
MILTGRNLVLQTQFVYGLDSAIKKAFSSKATWLTLYGSHA